jgi:hypothetical protein
MTESRGIMLEAGENILLTFLAKTKEGQYAVVDERPLSNLRANAYTIITNDTEYYHSTS